MTRASRSTLEGWIAGPHRGYRAELDAWNGRLLLQVRYRVRQFEAHTGTRQEIYRGPWQWVGCEEIVGMLELSMSKMHWRLILAHLLRQLRWHTRGRRS
jgi:hypothetical protein